MNTLTRQQARMMFRETDKFLLEKTLSPYDNNVLGEMEKETLEYFHCSEVYQLNLDDDYWKGIRANTFCIEVGWSEYYSKVVHGRTVFPALYIVTANHKGTRMFTMWAIEDIPWISIDDNREEAAQ